MQLCFRHADSDNRQREMEGKLDHGNKTLQIWFAAGPEIQNALLLLSDGAFRLYFYICLNASRKTERISMSYVDLANRLGKNRRSISSHFDELRRGHICRIYPAINQHHRTEIQVCDEFWPYTRAGSSIHASGSEQYLARIKAFLSERACVQMTFTAADQNIVANLLAHEVPIAQVERAIGLGCCRKYVSRSERHRQCTHLQDCIF